MLRSLNESRWDRCFAMIDPKLRAEGRVAPEAYAENLAHFMEAHGCIRIWHVKISLHLEGAKKQRDPRKFAYVYIIWQDSANAFHMFRDRWVEDDDRWYTRVVGLVPDRHAQRGETS